MRIAKIVAAGLLAAAAIGGGEGGASAAGGAPWGTDVTEPAMLLGRLHRAAMHEVELGNLARQSAGTPDARRYGAELVSDFRGVDERIVSLAAGLGIPEARLQVGPGENVAVLRQESDRMSRLAAEQGSAFDRDFWVTVADAQARESDLLAATAVREPALTDLVTQMSRLYDRSSRRALEAATTPSAPSTTEAPPAETAPAEPPPPKDWPVEKLPTEAPPAALPSQAR